MRKLRLFLRTFPDRLHLTLVIRTLGAIFSSTDFSAARKKDRRSCRGGGEKREIALAGQKHLMEDIP